MNQSSDMGSTVARRRRQKSDAVASSTVDRRDLSARRSPFVVRGSTVETPEGFKLRF